MVFGVANIEQANTLHKSLYGKDARPSGADHPDPGNRSYPATLAPLLDIFPISSRRAWFDELVGDANVAA